ncbi:MAG: hypothetical protein KBT10_06615, partial [Bacteroidales bacterium]|nr:hypothetical protein [Candidatus Sodaliphilus aphodohippi]
FVVVSLSEACAHCVRSDPGYSCASLTCRTFSALCLAAPASPTYLCRAGRAGSVCLVAWRFFKLAL